LTCAKCKGDQHVFDGEAWVPCDCLLDTKAIQIAADADLPNLKEVVAKLKVKDPKRILDRLKGELDNKRFIFLTGGTSLDRLSTLNVLAYSVIRSGRTFYSCEINAYIDAYLGQQNETIKRRVKSTGVLWLKFDFYRKHAWANILLTRLYHLRIDKLTLLTGDQAIADAFQLPKRTIDIGGLEWIVNS